ncbi:MAG: sigma-70 family RNA polymerase sigma factor [Candidatus Izemoplasmatales bacterium]|nr:sigma-70 family RNA polymerase sigma factor [Candidatus Izemoplasmatales bacterium]
MRSGNKEKNTDRELIKSFLEGNSESFDVLYARYKRLLYSYLNKLVPGQPQLADDIFQQAWIKAVRQMHTFGKEERFQAWLMKIAHNLLIDHFRKEKYADKSRAPEEVLENLFDDKTPSPWRILDASELGTALKWAVNELSQDVREVFILRQEDLSFKEIAEIQGCPVNTALGRMQYALKKLRELLKEWKSKGQ